MPPPSDPREPRLRVGDGRSTDRARRTNAPSREPRRRRPAVQAGAAAVLPPVLQDVHERVPHLARRREVSRVMTICPDASPPTQGAVDRFRHPDREPLDSASKHDSIVRLDEYVHVIPLHTELQHPETAPGCSREGATHRAEDVGPPQRRQIGTRPQRHVRGATAIVQRPTPVGHRATAA